MAPSPIDRHGASRLYPAGLGPRGFVVLAALLLGCASAACGDDVDDDAAVNEGSGLPDRPPHGLSPAEWGERLFVDQGCIGCHALHGARSVGGRLDGIWGEERTFADGSTGRVDEAYVRESIDSPSAKVVAGFPDVMPAYVDRLSQAQVDALVAFLETR